MSNLSQFFSSAGGGADTTNSSIMKLFTKSGCMTIPSAANYVTYSTMGGGGFSCIQHYSIPGAPCPTQGGTIGFCGAGGGGGGFAYKEQSLTLSNPLTVCAVVGLGGTAPVGQGGSSCVEDITTPTSVLSCISATGGQVCVLGTCGGAGSGGDINSCGAGVCGLVTCPYSISAPTGIFGHCISTDSKLGWRFLVGGSWHTKSDGTQTVCGVNPSSINTPTAFAAFTNQYFCMGGGGAGNIFGPGISGVGPKAGGMGQYGGSADLTPVMSGKPGSINSTGCFVYGSLQCCVAPTFCIFKDYMCGNVDVQLPEMRYYAQFTKNCKFSQNKTLFSASGGAGLSTICGHETRCCPVAGGGQQIIRNEMESVGNAFYYCVAGAAGGQGGGSGNGGFGGGGGEVGGNGGCGGGGGGAVHMYARCNAPTCYIFVCCFYQGCGGNGVSAVEYWVPGT